MELVYLWVAKHKNIENKGFNFSPRFSCDYDDKLKTLSIKKKDHFIEDFFGENIKITAIIGKNGAGKSAIIDQLQIFMGGSFKIYFTGEKFYLVEREEADFKEINSPEFDLEYISKSSELFNSFTYSSDLLNYHDSKDRLFSFMSGGDPSRNNNPVANVLGVESSTRIPTAEHLNIKNLHTWVCHESIRLIDHLDGIDLDFIPTKLNFLIYKGDFADFSSIDKLFVETYKETNKEINLYLIFLLQRLASTYSKEKAKNKDKDETKNEFLVELNQKLSSTLVDEENIIREIEEHLCTNDDELFDKLKKEDRSSFLSNIQKILKLLKGIIRKDDVSLAYESDLKSFKNKVFKDYESLFIKLVNIEFFSKMNLLSQIGVEFSLLSHGERNIYLINLITISEILEKHKKHPDKPFIIYLDEPDLSLHPEWQKNYIFELHKTFNSLCEILNIKIHFIISSHSPFLVSDIPNQNIIFLDKDKCTGEFKGKCIVVDDLEKKETFGANIHTLLSDGFFMEGLIGKFSQNKINELIKFLNGEESIIKDESKAEELIKIIGEPILKRMLQQRLDSKKLSKVEVIERDIEKLKEELRALKNDKD